MACSAGTLGSKIVSGSAGAWNMLKVPVLATSVLVTLASAAYAASFDCIKNQKADEVAICSDPKLSSLDEELAAIYGRLRSSLSPESAAVLRNSQLAWLRLRRACGNDRQCLTAQYQDRIGVLEAQMGGPSKERSSSNASRAPSGNSESTNSPVAPQPKEVADAEQQGQPNADDTSDILIVIRSALKCPTAASKYTTTRYDDLPPSEGNSALGGSEHETLEFTGTDTVFSVRTRGVDITLGSRQNFRREWISLSSIPLREVSAIEIINIDGYAKARVGLACRGGKDCATTSLQDTCSVAVDPSLNSDVIYKPCGNKGGTQPRTQKVPSEIVDVCDKATASILVEALKALQEKLR